MRLRPAAAALLLSTAVAVLIAGCSSSSSPSPTRPTPTTTPTPSATAPVSTGPTTAVTASCPYATQNYVHQKMGFRLGKVSVLRSGGQAVGCRFYAQQKPDSDCDATCLAGEKLPGPDQPAVEITTARYASDVAAHNAFVRLAGTSPSISQESFGDVTGLCFPTAFDPRDDGNDFACTVNKGVTLVLVRTVDTAHSGGTAAVLQSVLGAVGQ